MENNKEIIENIEQEIDDLYDKINVLRKKKTDLEYAQFTNLINKFWEIKSLWGSTYYMHVFEFFKHGIDQYIIRGHGFRSSFSPYWDDCYICWDRGEDIVVKESNIKKFMRDNIREISKEEFTDQFNKMIETCKEYFNKVKEIDYSKKDE